MFGTTGFSGVFVLCMLEMIDFTVLLCFACLETAGNFKIIVLCTVRKAEHASIVVIVLGGDFHLENCIANESKLDSPRAVLSKLGFLILSAHSIRNPNFQVLSMLTCPTSSNTRI